MTLKKLSTGSKVSISMISKVENLQTLTSIATYIKIASALGISFSQLISDDNTDVNINIVKATERPIITKGPHAASPPTYKKGKKEMEPFIFYYSKGKKFPMRSVRVYIFGHHYSSYNLGRTGTGLDAPYYIKILVEDKDVTKILI